MLLKKFKHPLIVLTCATIIIGSLSGCGSVTKSSSDPATGIATTQDQDALSSLSGKAITTGNNPTSIIPTGLAPKDTTNTPPPQSVIVNETEYPVSNNQVLLNGKTYTYTGGKVNGTTTWYSFESPAANAPHYYQLSVTKSPDFRSCFTIDGATTANILNLTFKGTIVYVDNHNNTYAKLTFQSFKKTISFTATSNTVSQVTMPFILTVKNRNYQGAFTNSTATPTKLTSALISMEANTDVGIAQIASNNTLAIYLRKSPGSDPELITP